MSLYIKFNLVEREGFEPSSPEDARFTVCLCIHYHDGMGCCERLCQVLLSKTNSGVFAASPPLHRTVCPQYISIEGERLDRLATLLADL